MREGRHPHSLCCRLCGTEGWSHALFGWADLYRMPPSCDCVRAVMVSPVARTTCIATDGSLAVRIWSGGRQHERRVDNLSMADSSWSHLTGLRAMTQCAHTMFLCFICMHGRESRLQPILSCFCYIAECLTFNCPVIARIAWAVPMTT